MPKNIEKTNMAYEPKHLKRWTRPDHYFGASWPHHFVFLGRHRDSDILTNSNFEVALERLEKIAGEDQDGDPTVMAVCENHWAVGWVEWIAIHESDDAALRLADEMAAALACYPVLDEDDLSEREEEICRTTWDECYHLRDRIRLLAENGHSIFAARRKYVDLGIDDDGGIRSRLLGY